MEQTEDQIVRLQVCEKCYEHHQYDIHSQLQFQQAYEKFALDASEIGIKVVRNVPPKYLTKAPNTKNSTKRYVDSNTGKIVDFPSKGSFQVYYKNILIYSKLQNIIFPDLNYLCMILKIVKSICQANPAYLNGLERFRHIEFQWRRNTMLSESLYNHIKQNACGNNSQRCAKDIIISAASKNLEQSRIMKKKTVHPYLFYDSKQKKHKIESIYCPRTPTHEFLNYKVQGSNITTNKLFAKSMQAHKRPQTGIATKPSLHLKTNSINKMYSQTQRVAGTIVKNNAKNKIFQLVINQQNKKHDEERFRKLIKQQKITISENRSEDKDKKISFMKRQKTKANSKEASPIKQKKFNLWSLSKCNRQKSSLNRDIYLQYLSNLKEKSKRNQEKIQLNFEASRSSRQSKQNNIPSIRKQLNMNQIDFKNCVSKQSIGQIPSTLRKSKDEKNNIETQLINVQKDENQFYIQANQGQQLIDILNQNEKSPIKNQDVSNKTESKFSENQIIEQKQQGCNQNQNRMSDSRLRRASIEQLTVKKRINERKRSSNHERYPHSSLLHLKFASLKMDCDDHQKDTIIADCGEENPIYDEETCQKEWQIYRKSFIYMRQPAQIVKKFAQQNNFINYNDYASNYSELMKSAENSQVQFVITGEQLLNKFQVISMRKVSKPTQIRLFPQIFKQIQPLTSIQTGSHNQEKDKSYFQNQITNKLIHVVNLMLRSNPMMISRLFEDKKSINPYGVYCIWLKNCWSGRFQPVFVNDSFAFQKIGNGDKTQRGVVNSRVRYTSHGAVKAIYSWLSHQNSIWYMLLQKAVAKSVGGYHIINQLSLAQLMSLLMGSPTVEIGYINPEKAIKVFDEKVFYNKMASLYTLRQNRLQSANVKQGKRIDRIIGFSYNKRDPRESAVSIKIQQSTLTVYMREFLATYGQICLLFFNNSYFLNQAPLPFITPKNSVISCRLISTHSKNNCYLIFSCFPQKCPTKVTLYRQLNDQQAGVTEGMNPLSEQNKRYEYIGQICKIGNFFFEVQINGGNYICLMENVYEDKPFFSVFSQYPVQIGQINCNDISEKQRLKLKKKKEGKNIIPEKEGQSHTNFNDDSQQTPKVLIQRKIKFQKGSEKSSLQKSTVKTTIRVKKQFAYQPDNFYDADYKDEDKQNQQISKEKKIKVNAKRWVKAEQ